MYDRFLFRCERGTSEVQVSFSDKTYWPDVLQEFFHFLKGCGYVFRQDEDLVEELRRYNDFTEIPAPRPEGSLVVTQADLVAAYTRTIDRWVVEDGKRLHDLLWNELQHVVRDREVDATLTAEGVTTEAEDPNDVGEVNITHTGC